MNAIKKMIIDTPNIKEKEDIILIKNSDKCEETKKAEKADKDYLNEKLYYFYNNGGPIMDL